MSSQGIRVLTCSALSACFTVFYLFVLQGKGRCSLLRSWLSPTAVKLEDIRITVSLVAGETEFVLFMSFRTWSGCLWNEAVPAGTVNRKVSEESISCVESRPLNLRSALCALKYGNTKKRTSDLPILNRDLTVWNRASSYVHAVVVSWNCGKHRVYKSILSWNLTINPTLGKQSIILKNIIAQRVIAEHFIDWLKNIWIYAKF